MFDIGTAARIFHDWSASEGYLVDGPTVAPVSTLAELATIGPELTKVQLNTHKQT